MKSLECILNLKTRIWSQKKTLFKDIRFVYKPWKYNDRLWQTRSIMTKENVIKSMFFVYKNTTSSKVCTVQKYVNKSVFSQFKPCLFFGHQRCIFDCHLYVSMHLKLAIYFTTYSDITKPIYLHHQNWWYWQISPTTCGTTLILPAISLYFIFPVTI